MKYSLILLLTLITSTHAATIGIIEDAIDFTHPLLASKMWSPPETDATGDYPGIINGWNFVLNTNEIYDFTEMDRIDNMDDFIIHAHGTHVAGIASLNTDHKLIGIINHMDNYQSNDEDGVVPTYKSKDELLEKLLKLNLKKFSDIDIKIANFTKIYPIDVANCSFGMSSEATKGVIKPLFKYVYGRDPSTKESDKLSKKYLQEMTQSFENLLTSASNTLFVFGAGNDGSNNDKYAFSPSDTNFSNAITVAATVDNLALASFSNYGLTTVDVAAPGVDIISTVPKGLMLPMSGTSMAAPFVSRIAGLVKDTNSKLTPKEIKKILIDTVDKKSFLKNKVKSGGMVSEKRSLRAATLSLTNGLDSAIAQAKNEYPQDK